MSHAVLRPGRLLAVFCALNSLTTATPVNRPMSSTGKKMEKMKMMDGPTQKMPRLEKIAKNSTAHARIYAAEPRPVAAHVHPRVSRSKIAVRMRALNAPYARVVVETQNVNPEKHVSPARRIVVNAALFAVMESVARPRIAKHAKKIAAQ